MVSDLCRRWPEGGVLEGEEGMMGDEEWGQGGLRSDQKEEYQKQLKTGC